MLFSNKNYQNSTHETKLKKNVMKIKNNKHA